MCWTILIRKCSIHSLSTSSSLICTEWEYHTKQQKITGNQRKTQVTIRKIKVRTRHTNKQNSVLQVMNRTHQKTAFRENPKGSTLIIGQTKHKQVSTETSTTIPRSGRNTTSQLKSFFFFFARPYCPGLVRPSTGGWFFLSCLGRSLVNGGSCFLFGFLFRQKNTPERVDSKNIGTIWY